MNFYCTTKIVIKINLTFYHDAMTLKILLSE